MVGLQEFIHKLELGEGVKWVRWTAVTLMFACLAIVYDMMLFRNQIAEESMDTAQLARNIATGKGYTTSFVRPFSMYILEKHRSDHSPLLKENHPDLANAPLYPVLLAGYMKVMPFNYNIREPEKFRPYNPDVLIAVFNQFWFALSLYLTYKIGFRLFGKGVAWFALGIFACTELFWRVSIWGGSTMLLLTCILAMVYALIRLEDCLNDPEKAGRGWLGWTLLAGVSLGAASLTRYSAICLWFPAVVYSFRYLGTRRKSVLLLLTVCLGIMLTPWLARNYRVSGHLFGIAGYAVYEDSSRFADNSFQRQYKPDSVRFGQFEIEDIIRKLAINARKIVQEDMPKLGGSWFTALFLASLLAASTSPAQGRMRLFVIVMIVTLIVVEALDRTHLIQTQPEVSSENLILLAAPLVFVFGAGFCVKLIEQVPVGFPELRILINMGIWAVFSLPLLLAALPPRPSVICYPPYYPFIIQHVASVIQDEELIMTDMPWAVAWYGQKKAIQTTITIDDFVAINDGVKPINAVYLTEITTDAKFLSQLVKGSDKLWNQQALSIMIKGVVDRRFPLQFVWTDIPMPNQLFIADYERWKMPVK